MYSDIPRTKEDRNLIAFNPQYSSVSNTRQGDGKVVSRYVGYGVERRQRHEVSLLKSY